MLRRFSKGQSTAEYAIVIGLVIGAAVAMQIYVKRGLQAKMKDAVDYNDPDSKTNTGGKLFSGNSYEPTYLKSEMDATSVTSEKAKTDYGGQVKRTIGGDGDVSTRTGQQVLFNPEEAADPTVE